MKEKDWVLDGEELPIFPRLLNPKRVSSETLSFNLGWVYGERLLMKSTGWRVQGGKILLPCVRTPKGFIQTGSIHDILLEQLITLLQAWRPHYKGVEFPEAPGASIKQETHIKSRPHTPEEYALGGAHKVDGSWVSEDGLCCRCAFTRQGGWIPSRDCTAHEFPETTAQSGASKG